MYPFLRIAREVRAHRDAPTLGMFDTHVSHHRIWPQDIDIWMELNNGRTLTLYDLGRLVLFHRTRLWSQMKAQGWVGTVAGVSVRYRRRVQMLDKVTMRSRIIGWDQRFLYLEQAMFRDTDSEATSHMLLRAAVTDRTRLIPMDEVVAALGGLDERPDLPEWVTAWADAEGRRSWPPMQD